MTDVFVSYSREDQAIARLFAEGFAQAGFSVWWDQSLNPGEAFDQVTEQALEGASVVVVLWSKHSVNSRWVRAEATQAHANNRLLPVMIESCRRPIMFELTHTAELCDWNGDVRDPVWQALVAGVRRFVDRGPPAVSSVSAIPATPQAIPVRRAPVRRSLQMPRRKVLVYGASALGLAAAGFAGGRMLRGGGPSSSENPVSFQRLTFRRGLIRSARFAPDGKTILYGALWDGEQCRVHSTRIDNPESRPLDLPYANLLAVSGSGDLALALGSNLEGVFTYGTLARVPISGGAPRELAEGVKFADWSPDGGALAIIRNVDGRDQLEFPPGKVLFRPAENEGSGLGFVRFSPDGKRLAFVHYREPQSLLGTVCFMEVAGAVSVATQEYVNIHGLAWHDEQIIFSASDDRPLFRSVLAVTPGAMPRILARVPVNVTLWDVAADGLMLIAQTDDRAVMMGRLAGDAHDRDLSWLDASWVADLSRDGSTVLFSETGQGVSSQAATYLRGTDGTPAVRLGTGQPLALSPDKRWALVLNTDSAKPEAGSSIDMVPTGAGQSRRLLQGQAYANARWLPDGGGILIKMSVQAGPWLLHRLDLQKGEPRPVAPDPVREWVLSPDGTTIAATGVRPGVHLLSLGSDAVRTVPGSTGREELIGWIREGLLVTRRRDPASPLGEVHLLDPGTGRQRSWANILPGDDAGIMLMGTFVATPDGSARVFTWHRALSNLYIAKGLA